MNNLILTIAIMTLPFRHFEFIKNDYYVNYCIGDMTYQDFIYKVFAIINNELFVKDFDEFILILESIFPQQRCTKEEVLKFYFDILKKLGVSLLVIMDNKVYLNQAYINSKSDLFSTYNENERILIWYYISRYMETNSIIISHLQKYVGCIENFMHQNSGIHIHVLNNYQDSIFKEGFYETHVHFGGTVGFNMQWWSLVGKYQLTDFTKDDLESLNQANPIKNQTFHYKIFVMASLVARYIMMKIIYYYYDEKDRNDYSKRLGHMTIEEDYGSFLDKYAFGQFDDHDELMILNLINKIDKEVYVKSRHQTYNDYIGIFIGKQNEDQSENIFMYHCIRYIQESENSVEKEIIIRCFLNYLRIKNSIFSLKIQTKAIKGLSYFTNFYHANSIKSLSLKEKFNVVMNHYYHREKIKGIELKVAQAKNENMDNLVGHYRENILYFAQLYQKWYNQPSVNRVMKLGLILMFKKEKIGTEICYEKFLKDQDYRYLNYGNIQIEVMETIMALQHLRNIILELADFVVGIDVAGNEYYCEPYVYAPAYRMVKNPYHEVINESKNESLVNMYNDLTMFPIKSLGLTYHVGEVFSSLISGLRHIDEVVLNYNYTEGDRIGHGLALALDLKRYLRDKKVTQIKKVDYLKNLLWIYIQLSKNGLDLKVNESELRNKILNTFRTIYSQNNDYTVNIHTLIDWYNYSFACVDKRIRKLKSICYFEHVCTNKNFKRENNEWSLEDLLAADNCQYYLNKMNESMLIVENSDDFELYDSLQRYVRKKVANKGIVVEINPVSNSLIGDIDDVTLLPYLNLDAIGFHHDSSKSVLLTVNTDDPAIFNTDLLFQFALLEAQLTNMEYSKKEINEWLDFIRKNSHYSTFVSTEETTIEHEKKALQTLVDKLKG